MSRINIACSTELAVETSADPSLRHAVHFGTGGAAAIILRADEPGSDSQLPPLPSMVVIRHGTNQEGRHEDDRRIQRISEGGPLGIL